ncbi:PKD domain-containing protein [Nocardioides sp. J9]|uniref:PKD domain-containing protein n=1 Tax=Nocardioides sp. J9 TaxID=935844 RepID=UPI0011A52745|nr:PKD domain-containing protein [Nocardioides sp. J9]
MAFLIFVLAAALTAPARADDDTRGGTGDNTIWVDQVEHSSDSGRNADSGDAPSPTYSGPHIILGSQACAGAEELIEEGAPADASFCQEDDEPETATLTVGMIRRAFAELKLPAGEMVVQPPDGLTLVNFDTNFYTTTIEPITRTVRLLGRQVTLEATPSRYTWTFGDGQSLTTTDPGAPYPRLTITHNYLRTGTYRPTLATTYTGRFRVGNGPWRQIPGTVTIDGTGQPLRAIEAEPKLVSY